MKTKWYLFFLTIITFSVVLYSMIETSEEDKKVIGVLMVGENRYQKYDGLKEGLSDLGYKKDELKFLVKNAQDDQLQLTQQIKTMLEEEPDLIVTMGGIETLELKKEMEKQKKQIPVVFAGVAAPKEVGLINDYRKPGGLFTGINNYHTDISGKRLELLKSLVPSIQRVHVLYDETIEVSWLSLQKTQEAAEKLGIHIVPCSVMTPDFKDKIIDDLRQNDAILVMPGFRIESLSDEIADMAREKKIPSMGIYNYDATKGFLASYGSSFYSQGYQASRFVSLIIQGNSPEDIPVELPDSISFVINQKSMDELGITLNKDLFYIAEFVNHDSQGGGE